jgi:hypothetical protein
MKKINDWNIQIDMLLPKMGRHYLGMGSVTMLCQHGGFRFFCSVDDFTVVSVVQGT